MSKRENTINHQFWENEDGVHVAGPNGEHMLCGDAFDGDVELTRQNYKPDFGEMKRTNKRTVTCARCIEMILHCRGIRFRKERA